MTRMSPTIEQRRRSAAQIAGLVVFNALIFQEVLSYTNRRVTSILQTMRQSDPARAFADHWQFILDNINYYPVFHVAHDVLLSIPASSDLDRLLGSLVDKARQMIRLRAAFRHDLMGRVYHTLLTESDAKYLGTYYTSVPAATFLLQMALDPVHWPGLNWSNLDEIARLRISDLACGTGTLLMATADAIRDNYTSASAATAQQPDLDRLHKVLVEDVLYGYDVLPTAGHLTASSVGMLAPHVPVRRMNLWNLDIGNPGARLGSIEFLEDSTIHFTQDLSGATRMPELISPTGNRVDEATLPDLDLCVMNPPFTRSTIGNLLFGSVPTGERRAMRERVAVMLRRPRHGRSILANATAGLGSVFAAVADAHLKPGGLLALVIPKAVLSGIAWQKTRTLLSQDYVLEAAVISHEPGHWNFSDSTALSEVLILASKLREASTPADESRPVLCVNLWHVPRNSWEALSIARFIRSNQAPDLENGQGDLRLRHGHSELGQVVTIPWGHLRNKPSWLLPWAFAQADLTRAAISLESGRLVVPGSTAETSVLLRPLNEIGALGPDARDVSDAFDFSSTATQYVAYYGNRASQVRTIAQSPNRYLTPLAAPRRERTMIRPLRRWQDVWPKAGPLLIARRSRLNTKYVASVLLEQPVLADVWWPFAIQGLATLERQSQVPSNVDSRLYKALAIWLNSTLGLVILLTHREDTEGAWVQFKKPLLARMPVLDVLSISNSQLDALAQGYDRLCQQDLRPFQNMNDDPVRSEIDQVVSNTCGLPDVTPLRNMLAREPIMCLNPLA